MTKHANLYKLHQWWYLYSSQTGKVVINKDNIGFIAALDIASELGWEPVMSTGDNDFILKKKDTQ